MLKSVVDSCERCGRTVSTPVRLTDLSHKPAEETYYACPFCFSRIDAADEHEHMECLHSRGGLTASSAVEVFHSKNETSSGTREAPTIPSCSHGFGYLNNRPKDSAIPDECLTCTRILQCMAKAI